MNNKAAEKIGKKKTKNEQIKQDKLNKSQSNNDMEMSKIKTGIN
jgi:hypothetical protein